MFRFIHGNCFKLNRMRTVGEVLAKLLILSLRITYIYADAKCNRNWKCGRSSLSSKFIVSDTSFTKQDKYTCPETFYQQLHTILLPLLYCHHDLLVILQTKSFIHNKYREERCIWPLSLLIFSRAPLFVWIRRNRCLYVEERLLRGSFTFSDHQTENAAEFCRWYPNTWL